MIRPHPTFGQPGGFGRESEARQYENGSQYISTTKSYDALGRVATASNPSRPGDGLNYGTSYFYDALGRSKGTQTVDGAATYQLCGRAGHPNG